MTDLHDMIRQLTTNHPHAEPYTIERNGEQWSTRHHTTVPALVSQLIEQTGNTAGAGAESHTAPRSKPAARLEALDTLMVIDEEAGDWIDRLGYTIPADKIDPATLLTIGGSGTILRLTRIHGLYPNTDTCGRQRHDKQDGAWCCARGHLAHDIRRWWQQARIITGWDIPAFRPRATCPICDVQGSLRVKPDGALCVECRSLWDASQIGLLAEHIRSENDDEGEAA